MAGVVVALVLHGSGHRTAAGFHAGTLGVNHLTAFALHRSRRSQAGADLE